MEFEAAAPLLGLSKSARKSMAIMVIGNTSHCAHVDRREGLLAKVLPETLDLADDQELSGSTELFRKKLKKAVFKDLKLAKEMNSLMGASCHGNCGEQPFKPFRQ